MLTIEQVKEELGAYRHNKDLIDKIQKRLDYYRTQAEACTPKLTDTPKSTSISSKVERYATLIADLEEEQYDWLIQMEEQKKVIDSKIKQLKQPYFNIIFYKYILGMELKNIAFDLGLDYKWCCKLHGRALQMYQKLD